MHYTNSRFAVLFAYFCRREDLIVSTAALWGPMASDATAMFRGCRTALLLTLSK